MLALGPFFDFVAVLDEGLAIGLPSGAMPALEVVLGADEGDFAAPLAAQFRRPENFRRKDNTALAVPLQFVGHRESSMGVLELLASGSEDRRSMAIDQSSEKVFGVEPGNEPVLGRLF